MAFDPSAPVPESDMRVLRPIGLALLALFLGANLSYLLLLLVRGLGGPDLSDHVQPAMYGLSVLFFFLLLRRSRRKRALAAQRAAEGHPRPVGRMMAAGVMAVALGGVLIWMKLGKEPVDARALWLGALMAMAGFGAVAAGVRSILARRA